MTGTPPPNYSPFTVGLPSLSDYRYWDSVASSQSNVVSPTMAPHSPADPVPQAPALWIETTAYGLLHLLLWEGKAEMADQAAAWLTHQAGFQGAFRSTQVAASLGALCGGGPESKHLNPDPTSPGHGDGPGSSG